LIFNTLLNALTSIWNLTIVCGTDALISRNVHTEILMLTALNKHMRVNVHAKKDTIMVHWKTNVLQELLPRNRLHTQDRDSSLLVSSFFSDVLQSCAALSLLGIPFVEYLRVIGMQGILPVLLNYL
jgi:hypothetical protein